MDDTAKRIPPWIPRCAPRGAAHPVKALLRGHGLETVCENARCPNQAECFSRRTATFLILGRVCTRRCRFCAVVKGTPAPPDAGEPERVAEAATGLGLGYVVVTSVTRDDLPDGGAGQFARTLKELGRLLPVVPVEVLTPDFGGLEGALDEVLTARPAVFNHNIETVARLYPEVRPGADYRRSLGLLRRAAAAGTPAKSGIMLGLGETAGEIEATMSDLRAAGCELLTIGQYLQPTRDSLPVRRFVKPAEFDLHARLGYTMGFKHVASGPLVRSSYMAREGFGSLHSSSVAGEGHNGGAPGMPSPTPPFGGGKYQAE